MRRREFEGVPGWLTKGEGDKLTELAVGKRVLEIGSYCGRSTIAMGQVCESLLSIDPHNGSTTEPHPPRATYAEFNANVRGLPVACLVAVIEDVEKYLPVGFFDLVFVDGDHSFEACLRDVAIARRVIVPGGKIVVHDYRTPYPQLANVTKAIDSLGVPVEVFESLAIL